MYNSYTFWLMSQNKFLSGTDPIVINEYLEIVKMVLEQKSQ